LLGALQRGANVSVDMITYDFAPDDQRIDVARVAIEAGFLRQVMLAHDALVLQSGPEQMFGIGPNDYGYISRVFAPKLQRTLDLTDEHLRTILVENPQRFLARF
jgi:predicted metal-dependent phosphotriesterase family hydrolase